MNRQILIDTGPIVAILSASDSAHERCVEAMRNIRAPLITTWSVITEAHWLLRKNSKAVESLFVALQGGLWEIESIDAKAIPWIAAFLKRYNDIGVQVADATLAYLAETQHISTIFTLDSRDFGLYRLSKNRALKIIPGR